MFSGGFFLTKGGYSFRIFNNYCNRELIPNCWRSCSESTFANIQLKFRNKCLETDYLRVLEISVSMSVVLVQRACNNSQFKFNSIYNWKPMQLHK